MPLSSRHGDPILEQIARDTFALFPQCHRCGQPIARFEDADVRVHVQRIVHRGECPPPPMQERLIPPDESPP
ncbi:MAG: hypothetical protein JWN53_1199 [Gemmatimonadetes bacterium]|jgi:hypothetical protein|nr:hypothetical protein [Gemmatimonadota bacterium]